MLILLALACAPSPAGAVERPRGSPWVAPEAPDDVSRAPIAPDDRRLAGSFAPPPDGVDPETSPEPVTVGLCDAWDVDRLDLVTLAAADDAVADVASLGIDLVRPHRARGHVFSWNLVSPPDAAVARWALPDQVVAAAGAMNVSLLATIYPTADPGSGGGGVVGVGPPSDVDAYETFVRAMVERYDGDGVLDMPGLAIPVDHWEIGNEPTCAAADVACQRGFVELVRVTAAAIRVADPEAFVIAGASAPLHVQGGTRNARAEAVYRYFVDHGGLESTDALNVHLATGMSDVSIDETLDLWNEIAGERPIWITEMATRAPGDVDRVASTPAGEAAWLTHTLDRAAARGVDHVFWCLTRGDVDRFPDVTDAIRDYNAR